jgi:hypothetical protein
VEKERFFNKIDESYGILCLNMSSYFLFHVSACKTPNEVWTTMEGLFGKRDEMRGNMLENELIYLIPRNFQSLQGLFSKFNTLIQ